jgi:hypothetical protein
MAAKHGTPARSRIRGIKDVDFSIMPGLGLETKQRPGFSLQRTKCAAARRKHRWQAREQRRDFALSQGREVDDPFGCIRIIQAKPARQKPERSGINTDGRSVHRVQRAGIDGPVSRE